MVYVEVKNLKYGYNQYKSEMRGLNTRESVHSFYICKFEVTQEQWSAVMGYNPSNFSNKNSMQFPVENVSWEECQEFIYTLNELVRGGVDFRLPTEKNGNMQRKEVCRAKATNTQVVQLHKE